jgi:hypothetical protein
MGADSCIVYYGVRYQVTDEAELEQLSAPTHPLMEAAKRVGLQYYWGNFSMDGGEYQLLLVGREIGIFGLEGIGERELADAEFQQVMQDTRERLQRGGFSLTPALQIQFEPDY